MLLFFGGKESIFECFIKVHAHSSHEISYSVKESPSGMPNSSPAERQEVFFGGVNKLSSSYFSIFIQ
jgi:hypothetical protein